MTSRPPAKINLFSAICVGPAPSRSLTGRVTCETALPSSSCHLWAAAWWGSVSQLSLLPARSLKPAAGCYTQGETASTEIKWNLILWLCANPSTEQLFILLPASMSCSQVSRQRDAVCQHVVVDVQPVAGHTLPTTLWQFYEIMLALLKMVVATGIEVMRKLFLYFYVLFFIVLTALCLVESCFSWPPWLTP